jgi:hypothetical protein
MQRLSATKACYSCKRTLPRSSFYNKPAMRDGLRTECKSCSHEYSKAWKKRNPDRARDLKRASEWRARGKRSIKDSKLRASYGIGLATFEALLHNQGDACALCGEPETRASTVGKRRVLCVDHCHDTGLVRGLLCAKCNSAIGHMRDDPALMRRAAEYVERHMASAMMVA